jgi:hypothetical protein
MENGLHGKVCNDGFMLLHYLKGWVHCKSAERISRSGQHFVWIDYAHAVSENPLLFSPGTAKRTKINRVVKLMTELRQAGLVETWKRGTRLFFLLTPTAERLFLKSTANAVGSGSTRAFPEGERGSQGVPVTEKRESPVTEKCETGTPFHIDETKTHEKEDHENTPIVPKGDGTASLEEIKESALRSLRDNPKRELTNSERRALAGLNGSFTLDELNSLERFYRLEDDLDEPVLRTRKRKFARLLGDLPAQITNARQRCPPPPPQKPEPPVEAVHKWMGRVYPNAALCRYSQLPDQQRKEFMEEHPQYREPCRCPDSYRSGLL